jgi:hypothetical protein
MSVSNGVVLKFSIHKNSIALALYMNVIEQFSFPKPSPYDCVFLA